MIQDAPLLKALNDGPKTGRAWWLVTDDGIRIRIGVWEPKAPNGTILLFPGRSEYIEKYALTAQDFATAGYATLSIDWRGQGLSDRLIANPLPGHIRHFDNYQHDMHAMLAAAEKMNLPRPWHLVAHSMGGTIGLRALINGIPVNSVTFSAPMWGIEFSPILQCVARIISTIGVHVCAGHLIVPGSGSEPYVLTEPFSSNALTNDLKMYERLIRHLEIAPGLSLSGPTIRWLYEAFNELSALSLLPSPDIPCLTFLGTRETIVSPVCIKDRMNRWPNGTLEIIPDALHEPLMDSPQMRQTIMDRILSHLAQNT